MDSLTNSILSAIEIIVGKKIDEAAYDRAVVAQITGVIDSSIGRYKLQYQDSVMDALATGNSEYAIGDKVYVLIPGNDITQERLILGATSGSRVSDSLANLIENNYTIIGNGVCESSTEVLNNIKIIDGFVVLYQYNESNNVIEIDQDTLRTYLQDQSNAILVSAEFLSQLSEEDSKIGQYQLEYEVAFTDGTIKTYIFDFKHMFGDPYNFKVYKKQVAAFDDIDCDNFDHVESVKWVVKNFNANSVIKVRNPQIYGAVKNPNAVLLETNMKLIAPEGAVFETLENEIEEIEKLTLSVQGRLLKQGKYITNTGIQYRYYIENPFDPGDAYGGMGWKRIPNDEKIADIKISEILFPAERMALKGVATYNGQSYFSELLFKNTTKNTNIIKIIRENNNSTLSLKCEVNDKESKNLTYQWMVIDKNGSTTLVGQTQEITFNLLSVDDYATYVCGVKDGETYLGTAREKVVNTFKDKVVKDIITYYAAHNSDIALPEGTVWVTSKTQLNLVGRYLWTKTKYFYTDNSEAETEPEVSGVSQSVALYSNSSTSIEPDGNDETLLQQWSKEPIAPTKENPEVYVTYGVIVNGAYLVGQDWTKPILYARYAADGAISIYRYAYQKVKYETTLSKPEKDWNELNPTDTPKTWCQVAVDLTKDYPFVYQCAQEEITKDGKVSYGDWSAPFLDRHWGEDYIYGYSHDETTELPTISNGNISWGDWSSADLPLDDLHPYVYRITGIIEGNVMQPLDDDMGGNGWWTSPVLYKNKSLNLTLTNIQYAVADSGNFTAEGNPPVDDGAWDGTYPDLNDNSVKGKYIWTKIIYSDRSIHYEVSYIANDGDPGSSGADAKDLVLKVDSLYVKQDRDNKISPSSVTFTAVTQNIEPTGYIWKLNGETQSVSGAIFKIENIDTSLFTNDTFSVSVQPKDSALSQYTDSVYISLLKDGNDAFSIINSNPSMIFNATDNDDVPESATIELWRGLEQINNFTISGHGVNGHTITITKGDVVPIEGKSTVTFDYTISAISDSYNFNSSFKIICTLVRDGDSVKDLTIHTTAFVVKKLGENQFDPETVTFSATVNGFKEMPIINWSPEQYNGTISSEVLFADGTIKSVNVTASTIVDEIEYKDTTTVVLVEDGKDAYTVANSNPVMVFHEKDDDTLPETAILMVYKGINKIKEQTVTYTKGSGAGVHTIDLSVTDEEGNVIPLSTTITVTIIKDGKDGEPGPKGDTGNSVTTIIKKQYAYRDKLSDSLSNWYEKYEDVANRFYVYIREREDEIIKNSKGEIIDVKEGTWSKEALCKVNGSDANVNLVNTFNALTNGGFYDGIYYSKDGITEFIPTDSMTEADKEAIKLYINASMIKTGILDADLITAGALTIGDKFKADVTKKTVSIGGFEVGDGQLQAHSSDGKASVVLNPYSLKVGSSNTTDPYFYADYGYGVGINYGNLYNIILTSSKSIGNFIIGSNTQNTELTLGYDSIKHNNNSANWDDIIAVANNKNNYLLATDAESIYAKIGTVYTKDEINGEQGLLKNYYTKAETDAEIAEAIADIEGGITGDLSNYLKKNDKDSNDYIIGLIDPLFATTNEVTSYVAQQLQNYYTKTEILKEENGNRTGILASYYTKAEIDDTLKDYTKNTVVIDLQTTIAQNTADILALNTNLSLYYKIADANDKFALKTDLDEIEKELKTKTTQLYVDGQVTVINNRIDTVATEITNVSNNLKNNYYNQDDIDAKFNSIPTLDDYYTRTEIDNKGFITSANASTTYLTINTFNTTIAKYTKTDDLDDWLTNNNYANREQTLTAVSILYLSKDEAENYATKTDLNNYTTTNDLTKYYATQDWTTQMITSNKQDLTDYAKTIEVTAMIETAIGQVLDTSVTI